MESLVRERKTNKQTTASLSKQQHQQREHSVGPQTETGTFLFKVVAYQGSFYTGVQ